MHALPNIEWTGTAGLAHEHLTLLAHVHGPRTALSSIDHADIVHQFGLQAKEAPRAGEFDSGVTWARMIVPGELSLG